MIKFLRALLNRFMTDNISFLAGGVAFYWMWALFPALAAIVSLFGLVASPTIVNQQLESVQLLFPPEVFKIFQDQLGQLTAQSHATLSLTIIVSLLVTIYSSTKGTNAMLAALNSVFRINDTRSWYKKILIAYGLTFGAFLILMLTVFVVIAIPLIMHFLPDYILLSQAKWIESTRWLALAGAVFAGLFVLFAYGPDHSSEAKLKSWRSVFWGAFIATALWIGVSVVGSMIVQFFPGLNAAYGSLSAIIALMTWLYASAYAVLLGGAITAEAEEFGGNIDQAVKARSRA